MTDKGIIFSAPMVRALLAGNKTQTRRLASSPLAKAQPGDRLWVREAWKATAIHDRTKPSDLNPATPIYFTADDRLWPVARYRPGMHMPRWASRLTLTVTDVRVQRLSAITSEDAIAEGVQPLSGSTLRWQQWSGMEGHAAPNPVAAYGLLWGALHTKPGETWADDPWVVAITFDVRHGNIDAEVV